MIFDVDVDMYISMHLTFWQGMLINQWIAAPEALRAATLLGNWTLHLTFTVPEPDVLSIGMPSGADH